MLEELCSPENPKQYQILDWAAETNIGDIRPKKENHPILLSELFVLLSKFQSSCTLLGCEQRFLLPSERSPTVVFYKPQDSVFSPNMAFAC